MRKSYVGSIVDRALRGGHPGLVLTAAARFLALRAGRALGRPLAGPVLGILAVTRSCPHRCDFCDVPHRREGQASAPQLDAPAKVRVLEGFATLGCLAVTFTGGEPMLDPDLPDLVSRSASLGLMPHLSTTGWGLDAAAALRLVRAGLSGATITVAAHPGRNAPRPEAGIAALQHLADAGRAAGRHLSLTTTTVLSPGRLPQAAALVQRLLDLGFEQVGVMPELDLSVPPGRPGLDEGALRALAADLIAWKSSTGRIDNSNGYLRALPRCAGPAPLPVPCVAPYSSVIVDATGSVHACAPAWMRGVSIGNVQETPVEALWRSPAYAAERRRLRDCRDCLWNCHAEMSLAVAKPWNALR
jgi:MoaA/NifB/PqqE/SkfB family radical SAM enzyme